MLEARSPERPFQARRDTYSILGAHYVDGAAAARAVVRAVKLNVLRPVRIVTVEEIVNSGLEGMRLRFSADVAARLVVRVAELDLTLLPNEQRIVKQTCIRFARGDLAP